MKIKHSLSALIIFFLIFSCKKEEIKTDNVYKFKEYISYTTSGITSVSSTIDISLAKDVEGWETNQELPSDLISTKPYVKGKIKTINKHAFIFTPNETLAPDTEYVVTIKLHKIYKNIPQEFENYTFQFKTKAPNYSIQTNVLQSYSKEYQYLEGVLKSANIIALVDAKKIIKASQNDNSKSIVWNESSEKGKVFEFKIDSIKRFENDSQLEVTWNGKAIKSDNKGENKILIPGKNNFNVLDVKIKKFNEQYISINFSDALKK